MIRLDCRWASPAIPLAVASLLAACENVVYRDADPFTRPPEGAGEFLGYSSVDEKKTTCGNCHSGKQAMWQLTAHSDAWVGLHGSANADASCEGCHTVTSKGNLVTADSVGWIATRNARYQDVQCESCHGPGLTHVLNPDATDTKPLASVAVGPDLTYGCGECHSGTHRPFAEEWRSSKHARVIASRATNPSCIGCHEAKGILTAWGVKSTFREQSTTGEHLAVTCAVCHDPHDARNEGQLRFPMDVAVVEENLCMKCHRRRATPDPTSSSGPHSPEGPLLLGEAGWFPPNFEFPPGALVGSHGSDRNPRLCATCHVNDYEVRDALTGSFSFRATGHSFQAIPCVGTDSIPTGATDCAITERSFRACTVCHLDQTSARSALILAQQRIADRVTELSTLIARIPSTEFSTSDNRYTTGEGAKFNMSLAQKKGSAAHNPFLVEALLLASIRQVKTDYQLTAAASAATDGESNRK